MIDKSVNDDTVILGDMILPWDVDGVELHSLKSRERLLSGRGETWIEGDAPVYGFENVGAIGVLCIDVRS